MIIREDRRFFWTVVLLTLVVTLIPHLVGWGRVIAGDFAEYQAYNSFGAADTNVYFSYINQARHGALLFENLFTGEAQQPVLFHPLWLVSGWVGASTSLATPIVFQLMRVVAGLFFLVIVYRFCCWIGLSQPERRFGLILLALTSGLGIFMSDWQHFSRFQEFASSDLRIAESNTFASLYHSPLFPLSQALVVLAIHYFFKAFESRQRKDFLISALAVFLLSIIHTYDLITIAAVLGALGIALLLNNQFQKPSDILRYIRRGLALIPIVIPAALYFIFVLMREPAIAGWLEQNRTISPSFSVYLLGFGLAVPLGILGAAQVLRRKQKKQYVLLVWVITSTVLMYAPHLTFQRRLSSGIHIPLALLAAIGLFFLWQWLYRRYARASFAVIGAVLILFIATPVGIVVRDSMYLARQTASDHPYFISAEEKAAQQFLSTAAGTTGSIYSDPWQGNELGGQGRRVFIGHGHQTVDWATKRADLDDFFTRWNEGQRRSYFEEHGISWLYYGPRERQLGPWQPEKTTWLTKEFTAGSIEIYRFSGS